MNMSASISDNSLLLLPLLFDCAIVGLDNVCCYQWVWEIQRGTQVAILNTAI